MIRRLNDESGASILIALLFFLICLAVGGVVITAASVNANTVPREVRSQQTEYDVGCAARTFADQMAQTKLNVSSTVSNGIKSAKVTKVTGTEFARAFWSKQATAIMGNYVSNKPTTFTDLAVSGGTQSVKGTLDIDANLNLTAKLALNGSDSYAMTVYLQAIPTYDMEGRLKSITYETPVIQKTGDAATSGGKS